MRRNGTGILATAAILGGAAIGVGGTLALVGNPFGRGTTAKVECSSVHGSGAGWSAWWTEAVGEDGHSHVKRCPNGSSRFIYVSHPAPRHAEVKALERLENVRKGAPDVEVRTRKRR